MLTYLSRAIGFIICVLLMLVGLVVIIKKFIVNYVIVSEAKDAKRRRDAKRAKGQSA